eukprot:UN00680
MLFLFFKKTKRVGNQKKEGKERRYVTSKKERRICQLSINMEMVWESD